VVDIEKNGLTESLRAVLRLYKRPENSDSVRFVQELEEAAKAEGPAGTVRRFLNWGEAREMIAGGMAIGSHTHSHQVLSRLEPDQQYKELSESRAILKDQLKIEADVLAYPVGRKTSFTDQTQEIARDTGYRAAFSHHGGTNMPGKMSRYNVKRSDVDSQSWSRFRVQTAVCRLTGSYWP
jgi:hypothetical protein